MHSRMVRSAVGCGGARSKATLIGDEAGSAAVEFALLAPVLVMIVMGMIDYGSVMNQTMQVAAAAHAGAEYAIRNGWNANGIQTAVTGATTLTVSASPAPQLVTACISNGAVVTTAAPTCASGAKPGHYVVVSAQATVTPLVAWPSFVMPAAVSSQATIRIN